MRPVAIALMALVLAGSAEARGKKLAHRSHVHKSEVVQTVVQGPVEVAKAQPPAAPGTMLTGVDAGRPVVIAPKAGVYAVPLEMRTAIAAPLVTSPVIAASAVVAPVVAAVPALMPVITSVPAVPVALSQFVTGVPAALIR